MDDDRKPWEIPGYESYIEPTPAGPVLPLSPNTESGPVLVGPLNPDDLTDEEVQAMFGEDDEDEED